MAFPVIEAVGETNGSAAAVDKVCNLPAGIVSGDLLILELRSNVAGTHTTPTGWTLLFLNNTADASDDHTSCWYRVADGAEGGSVTVTDSASSKFSSVSFRISGHDSATAPVISAIGTGTTANPNPQTLTPAGGAKDFLWLAMAAYEGEQTDPPTFPTSYALGQVAASSGVGGVIATNSRSAGAGRQLNAATEDPGTYTISVSDDWTAWTIAVYPAAVQGALLEGSIAMTATLVGALTTAITMAGAAAANLAAAAILTTQITLGGAVAGQMAPAAALTTEIQVAGAVAGQLTPSGDLTTSQQALLEGQIAGTLSGAGDLTTEIRLAGTAAGQLAPAGALETAITMSGATTNTATLAGDLQGVEPAAFRAAKCFFRRRR